jgi:hypothetical protein
MQLHSKLPSKNVSRLTQKFTGCMFLDFLAIGPLYQNIKYWITMIHLMCIRVPTYSRQLKNWVQQLPKFKTELTSYPKKALTMTLPWYVHCPIASNKRRNINTTTSPDLSDAPLVALRCWGLVPSPSSSNEVVLSITIN